MTDSKNNVKTNSNSKKKKNIKKISTALCRISLFAFSILGASSIISAITKINSSTIAASMGIGMLLLSIFFIAIRDN